MSVCCCCCCTAESLWKDSDPVCHFFIFLNPPHPPTPHRLRCACSDVRWNKGTILRASVDYIKRMQKDVQRTREVENNFKRMEMANKQLLLRIQVTHPRAHSKGEFHYRREIKQTGVV